jgi:ribosomal-protein-alanine N-acetyltransferase
MTFDQAFERFPVLATGRLRLRQIKQTDAQAIFAIKSDERVTETYGEEPHRSLDDTHLFVQRQQAYFDRREGIMWYITLKGDDAAIGSCCFWNFSRDLHCAEVGYELHRAHWRQGIMTEAVSAILSYGFSELGFHRVEECPLASNAPSRSLLLKLGFTYEGNLRQRVFFRGRFEDQCYLGLLRDEWLRDV